MGWGRSKQPSANPSWRGKQSSGPALSTPRPSGCCYLPQILLQEGDLAVVPGPPGTEVGQAQQPGVELIAQGWPQPLLVSLEHLHRERGRAESQSSSGFGRAGAAASCTHPILLAHRQGDLGAQHHPCPHCHTWSVHASFRAANVPYGHLEPPWTT